MRVFITGPMRNYALWNFPAFDDAAVRLRALGHEVVSPAEHDREGGFDPASETLEDFDLRAAFAWDIEQVLAVDAVITLPGWKKSRGASAEVAVAIAVGTPVLSLSDFLEMVAP